MKNFMIMLCCFVGLVIAQEKKINSDWQTYSSLGLFDHRSGMTFYSLSKTKSLSNDREIFGSVGSVLFIQSVAAGMRFNFKSRFTYFNRSYAVVSLRVLSLPTQTSNSNFRPVPTVAFGYEKVLSDKSSINVGAYIGFSDDGGSSPFVMPTISYIRRR